MCLTEPHCGTDLGLLKPRLEPNGDGSYSITGTKIFISAGEHDMSDNIIHLVRWPPAGFAQGREGHRCSSCRSSTPTAAATRCSAARWNTRWASKANATAVINLDGAKGYLIGERDKGLACMFTMMNAARLGCGMQGLGLGEASVPGRAELCPRTPANARADRPESPGKSRRPDHCPPGRAPHAADAKAYTEAGCAMTALGWRCNWTSKKIPGRRRPQPGR